MQCVILAGGLGTRMRPLTERMPKTLLPVGDVPFAHYQLDWLASHGVTDVVYSIGVLGQLVRAGIGDGSRWGLKIHFVEDGDRLLGTAGALRRAYDAEVLHESFLVLYGDSFLPIDFRQVWQAFRTCAQPALMTVHRNNGQLDRSNVCYADGRVLLYRKAPKDEAVPEVMRWIDYGLSAFRAPLIAERIPHGRKTDLADLCHALSVEGLLAGLEVRERFYEIGSPAGLDDFEKWTKEHPRESWASR